MKKIKVTFFNPVKLTKSVPRFIFHKHTYFGCAKKHL